MNDDRVWNVNYLENTRLIYAGIKAMYENGKRFSKEKLFGGNPFVEEHKTLEEYVSGVLKQYITPDKAGNDERHYRHPQHLLFRFLEMEPTAGAKQSSAPSPEDCKEELASMLQLYHAVEMLRDPNTDRKDYPQRFTYLCNCIRQLLDADMCYLLYCQREQSTLLSTSDLLLPDPKVSDGRKPPVSDFRLLEKQDFDRIRGFVQSKRRRNDQPQPQLWCNTVLFDDDAEADKPVPRQELLVLLLEFPRHPYEEWRHEWFYVVLQRFPNDAWKALDADHTRRLPSYSAGCEDRALLRGLRNVLFLRQHMFEQCREKMHILMTDQRSYRLIQPIHLPGQKAVTRHCRILHLTDLHIQGSGSGAKLAARFESTLKKMRAKTPIDLLVITGDVIQGQSSARSLEDNYREAADFIRSVAYTLWKVDYDAAPAASGDPNGGPKYLYVRPDWNKRIVIVPGNHDYATMNELETTRALITGRVTGSGQPSSNEASLKVKFSYYIDFLQDLLDCDINELIAFDLNELRNYSGLRVEICSLNTVSGAGPLRNNKVLLQPDKVLAMLHAPRPRDAFPLLLAHHMLNYQPDYLLDRYYIAETNGLVCPETQSKWFQAFHDALAALHDSMYALESFDTEPFEVLKSAAGKALEEAYESTASAGQGQKKTLSDFAFGRDLELLIRDLKEQGFYTEQIARLYNSVHSDLEMSRRDQAAFEAAYKKILEKFPARFLLGGHTHRKKYQKGLPAAFSSALNPMAEFLVGDRFEKDNTLYWNTLTIGNGTATAECFFLSEDGQTYPLPLENDSPAAGK